MTMNSKQYMELHQDFAPEYCPCVIDKDGTVFDCPKGHLEALFDLDETGETLAAIPSNLAPLFYMISKTGAVAVDYENQVFNDTLTPAQHDALMDLSRHGFIRLDLKNIHGHIYL